MPVLQSYRLEGMESLLRSIAGQEAAAETAIRQFLGAASMHLEAEVKERTPTASGGTRASIFSDVRGSGVADLVGLISSAQPHVAAVELGSKPHFPPVDAIQDWVEVKLGLRDDDAEDAAYAIAWKIAHHGTEGAFMFRDASDDNQGYIQRGWDAVLVRLGDGV